MRAGRGSGAAGLKTGIDTMAAVEGKIAVGRLRLSSIVLAKVKTGRTAVFRMKHTHVRHLKVYFTIYK